LAALDHETGVTARDLAKRLGADKSEINSILYRLSGQGKTRKNDSLEWFLFNNAKEPPVTINSHLQILPVEIPSVASPYNPTPEQQPVIQSPADAQLFVEAGPGTGKSETLVARLAWLLADGGPVRIDRDFFERQWWGNG